MKRLKEIIGTILILLIFASIGYRSYYANGFPAKIKHLREVIFIKLPIFIKKN
jgi:hypothetical protein